MKPTFANLIDPEVLAIKIHECGEELVDIARLNTLRFGPSPEVENNTDYTKLRRTVYEKLLEADRLLPKGLHLCRYEGWRSLQLQEKLFLEHKRRIAASNPKRSEPELFRQAVKMVSPVVDAKGSKNVPPHSTGGAVDVYLVDGAGKLLDMGLEIKNWTRDLTGDISRMDSPSISPAAKKNRRIIAKTLSEVGFVNYPGEYWHWSYGDRYWAFVNKKPNAIYGVFS